MTEKTSDEKTVKRPQKDTILAFSIAVVAFAMIIAASYNTKKDYILSVVLLLSGPVLFYEIGLWCKEFYQQQFGNYRVAVNAISSQKEPVVRKRAMLLLIKVLYSFTFLTIACVVAFFTYETVESSYYGTKAVHDMEHHIVTELQQNLLSRFCCPQQTVSHKEIHDYLNSQIKSVLLHYHIRKNASSSSTESLFTRTQSTKETDTGLQFVSKVEQLIDRVMDVLEHNTGFSFNFGTESWTWNYDFKPVDVLKYHGMSEQPYHDRIQTFFRKLTKGFGLTH